jgi:hypothetical protein
LYSLVVLCETNVLNLISQRLDTIYQIKPKRAIVLFFIPFRGTKHTHIVLQATTRLAVLAIARGVFTSRKVAEKLL